MNRDAHGDPETAARIDALVRAARSEGASPDLTPEQIEAYLAGELGEQERERIQGLLAGSRELRDELLHLAALREPASRAAYDAAVAPPAPPRPGAVDPRPSPRPEPVPAPRPGIFALHGRRLWGLGSGLAAAAVLMIVLLQPGDPVPLDWVGGPTLLVDQFETDPVRGSDTGDLVPRTTAEAATLAWRERAYWDGEALALTDPVAAPDTWTRTATIRFTDPSGGEPFETTIRLPKSAADPELSWLDLDTRRSFRAGLTDDRVSVPWPSGDRARGLLTVAFILDGKPAAAPALLVTP